MMTRTDKTTTTHSRNFKSTFEITLSASIIAVTCALNFIFQFIPGFEITTFVLLVCGNILKWRINLVIFNVTNVILMLIFGIKPEYIGTFILWNLNLLIIVLLNKYLVKHWWLNIILIIIFTLGFRASDFFVRWLAYDLNTARAMFFQDTLREDVRFSLNILFVPTLMPGMWKTFGIYREYEWLFNKYYLSSPTNKKFYKIKRKKEKNNE